MSNRITEEQKSKAIEEYARTGNLSLAGKAAGVSRITLWNESKRSKVFKTELENAKAIYTDALEELLDGYIRSGECKNTAHSNLIMFKIKAEMPDKYRERIDHKVEGNIKIITGVPRPTGQSVK